MHKCRLEEEIKKNFTEQKQENIRLQQIISVIKVDITETNAASLSIDLTYRHRKRYIAVGAILRKRGNSFIIIDELFAQSE
jgi:hypothetical protein